MGSSPHEGVRFEELTPGSSDLGEFAHAEAFYQRRGPWRQINYPRVVDAEQIGRYRLLSPIHAGGGGTIVRARAPSGKIVAIKRPHGSAPAASEALRNEIAVLQQLQRAGVAGVVRLLDFDDDEREPWYAMELIDGVDLRTILHTLEDASPDQPSGLGCIPPTMDLPVSSDCAGPEPPPVLRRPLPAASTPVDRVPWALRLILEFARILARVHDLGLLHGDLSPGNVMVCADGSVVLLDFGTAFGWNQANMAREAAHLVARNRGTPGYMAPEIIAEQSIDSRSDIYALGCIAFELLLGKRPFSGSTPEDLARQHLLRPVTFPPDASTIPATIVRLLEGMLQKEPLKRTAHVRGIVESLEAELGEVPSTASSSSSVGLFRPRLRSREGALAEITTVVDDALAARGGLVLITGTHGIGKTRLLNEGAVVARRAGMTVLGSSGVAAPMVGPGTSRPRGLALDTLLPILDTTDGDLGIDRVADPANAAAFDQARTALTPYGAGWGTGPPIVQGGAVADGRERVFDALLWILSHRTTREPLFVVLDDLHWGDDLSLEFLEVRAEALGKLRVVFLASCLTEADPDHLARIRRAARREIALQPISPTDVGLVARDLLGVQTLPEGMADFLARHAGGNPFVIAEYVRAALDRQFLRVTTAGDIRFELPSRVSEAIELPTTVQGLLAERMSRLPDTVRRVAQLAAVIGREFDDDAVRQLQPSEEQVTVALGALVSRQILEPSARGRYRFTHDNVREALEASLAPASRADLHRRLAERLERRGTSGDGRSTSRLGYHWAQAGEPRRALPYLEAAARQAADKGDHGTACELFRWAISMHEDAYGIGAATTSLHEGLGDSLTATAQHRAAHASFDRALRTLDGPAHLEHARLWRKHAVLHWTVHEYEDADLALDKAERYLRRVAVRGTSEWQEIIQIRLGRFEHLYFAQRRGAEITRLMDELAPLIEIHGTAAQQNAYYVAAVSQRMLESRYAFDPAICELGEKALAAARVLPLEARCLARFVFAMTKLIGPVEACRAIVPDLQRALEEAKEVQSTTLTSRTAVYLGIAYLRQGAVRETDAAAAQALAAALTAQMPPYVAAAKACQGWVAWRRGLDRAAMERLTEARDIWTGHSHPFPLRWLATLPLLAYASAEDDLPRAVELLNDLLDDGQQALPEPLLEAVVDARAACLDEDTRTASTALSAMFRLARASGYC